ncbi:MAG: CvpA family protein [Candidatus Berkelbacteria bacterium]|nr:CvpA family protein [Candidatus Berkelbacteria bacterium]
MSYLIDIIIILIFVFYLIDGYRNGFIKNFFELLGAILALYTAFILNNPVSSFLISNFPLPLSLSKIVAFLLIWLMTDIIYSIGLFFAYRPIPPKIKEAPANKIFGILPAFFKAVIIVLLVLIFLTSIPIRESQRFKGAIEKTHIAKSFLGSSSILQKPYEAVFGKGIEDLVNFFTLPPQSDKIVALNYRTQNLKIDDLSENEMLSLINQERRARDISEVKMDDHLRDLAREHSKDMFERGYFSHYTPEGLSPFDRLRNAGIIYVYAGENLALAPDVSKAEQGLMDSEGHRENILNPNFNKVGIGIVDAGIYGRMFTQEFTD